MSGTITDEVLSQIKGLINDREKHIFFLKKQEKGLMKLVFSNSDQSQLIIPESKHSEIKSRNYKDNAE